MRPRISSLRASTVMEIPQSPCSVTADVNEKSLRYRLASVLPGRGYRKLISRLVASQQEYFAIDRAIRNVWYGEGGTGAR